MIKNFNYIQFILLLFMVVFSSCRTPQNVSLNNESAFSRVPVMLSNKQTLGNGHLETQTLQSFDYQFSHEATIIPGYHQSTTINKWSILGLVGNIPMGTSVFLKSVKKENSYIHLKGPCSYQETSFFAILIGIDNRKFNCPTELADVKK